MIDILLSFEVQAIIRLILGFILAGIIGSERESLNKPAGFKTHSIIGVSSVLIMLCGEYLSLNWDVDASRIPAQLLSGIGFIGAGTILRDGFNVKGLTTAASLLAVTCIGLSIGAGFYLGGIITTIFAYYILSHSHNFFNIKDSSEDLELSIVLQNSPAVIPQIEQILYKNKLAIQKIKVVPSEDDDNKEIMKLIAKHNGSIPINKIIAEISSLKDILEVEI